MEEENKNPEEYFCTECGVVVNKEDKVCPKCGADLSELVDLTEKEDETEKIDEVIVKVFMNEVEAQLAKEQLESEGIKCFIMSDNYGGMMPSLNLTGGVKLIVNEYNYEKAVEVLKAMDMF
jgi:hypothetical protein